MNYDYILAPMRHYVMLNIVCYSTGNQFNDYYKSAKLIEVK
jgi:hypothetical protein